MTIAAHFFASKQQPSFLYPIFLLIARDNPGVNFIFFTENNVWPLSDLPANCKVIPVSPSLKNGLLLHYWYNFKLPSILKKYDVATLVTEPGVCCLRTNTPQILLIKDLSFLQKQNQPGEYSFYIKKFFRRFIHKASSILLAENYMVKKLLVRYPSVQQKVSFTGYGLNHFYQPVEPDPRQHQLSLHTEGYEYFVCDCSTFTKDHLTLVLKAYSIFKKRLKSKMRLVLLLRDVTADECIKDFKNYKYRNEVKIIMHEADNTSAALISAAYAFIYLPGHLPPANAGLHAMRCGVPLITCDTEDARSVYGDAVLYSHLRDQSIADNMMLLYKDENARNEYIRKGSSVAATYKWPDAANRLWQTILNTSRD